MLALVACHRKAEPHPAAKVAPSVVDAAVPSKTEGRPQPLSAIELPEDEYLRVVNGLRGFSQRLSGLVFEKFSDTHSNTGFSPVSVALVLGMLAASGDAQTQEKLAGSLGLSSSELHPALHWLQVHAEQAGRNQSQVCEEPGHCKPKEVQQTVFANGAWFQPKPLRADFRSILEQHYAAELGTITPDIQEELRAWVDQKTLGLIPDFRENVSNTDLCELVNVLYFSARWRLPFSPKAPFYFTALNKRHAPIKAFRAQWGAGHYQSGPDYEAVTIDYAGSTVQALVILPRPGRFETVGKQLNDGRLVPQDLLREAKGDALLDVTMPEFEATSRLPELGTLLDQVTKGAFLRGAFAYYAGETYSPSKGNAVQRVYIHVDEKGTLAAAATLITETEVSAITGRRKPPVPIVVRVNRPFYFFVRTTVSGIVLFAARVTQPLWIKAETALPAPAASH